MPVAGTICREHVLKRAASSACVTPSRADKTRACPSAWFAHGALSDFASRVAYLVLLRFVPRLEASPFGLRSGPLGRVARLMVFSAPA